MVTLAHNPAYRKMTVGEFLELEIEGRAELDNGAFYMMTGGSVDHAAVAASTLVALATKLRGSDCRPFGPDLAVRTGPTTVRLPDVSVYCGFELTEARRREKLIGEPTVVFEVLSPSTSSLDQEVKLPEYQALEGVAAVVIVDPALRRVRLAARSGGRWDDDWLPERADVPLPSIGVILTYEDIFG